VTDFTLNPETGLWTVRAGRTRDDLFICEAKGLARVARMWNGRSLREENAVLMAAAPAMRFALERVVETVTPRNAVERSVLALASGILQTSYLHQGGKIE
jgi:hypothetical protein